MKDLAGKVAVVTGAGDGIGRSMALAFAREGMDLVIADINSESLDKVATEIKELGAEVFTKTVDVSDRDQMAGLAEDAFERFGRVNVLCNNAGLASGGGFAEINLEDWDWVLEVDLYGVIYGMHFFLGRMLASGEECHIVNTSSMAGLATELSPSTYGVAKAGVVAMSEALSYQIRGSNVGVSVLCPGCVNTNILQNMKILADQQEGIHRASEEELQASEPFMENIKRRLEGGLSPDVVARMVINSIQEKRLYILPHPEFLQHLDLRMNAIRSDALGLQAAMASMGIGTDPVPDATYEHQGPDFSISYPSDWVEQTATPLSLQGFQFRAVSASQTPDLTLLVNEAPAEGLSSSIASLVEDMSTKWGVDAKVLAERQGQLSNGTPTLEAEIEMPSVDGVNQLLIFVLNTIHAESLISVQLACFSAEYKGEPREALHKIAYSLSF